MNRFILTGLAALAVFAWMPAAAQSEAEPAPEAPAAPETMEAPAAPEDTSSAEATAGMAGAAVCKRGETQRLINVVAPGAEGRVCEMHYAKPTEGVEPFVMWYATSDTNFCNEKATALMTTLTTAGWACTAADGTPFTATAATEEAPAAEPAVIEAPAEEAPESPEPPADAPDDEGQ